MSRSSRGGAVHSLILGAVLVVVLSLTACQSDSTGTTNDPEPSPSSAPVDDTSDHAEVNASIDRLLGPHADYETAFEDLRRDVAAADATAVSTLVQYPLTVTLDGKQTEIAGADELVSRYDDVVTPALAESITSQQYADLLVSQEGVRLTDSDVLLAGVCQDDACATSKILVVILQPAN